MAELFRAALVKNFFAACNESAQESYVIAKKKALTGTWEKSSQGFWDRAKHFYI